MTLQELKEKINNIFSAEYSTSIYLVLKQDDNLKIKLADIENSHTKPEIEDLFVNNIKSRILNNDELELCELSIADQRDNAIYHYDYDEFPEELGLFNEFNIETYVGNIEKFDFSQDDLSKLHGYIIYIGSMKNGIVLFKKHYPISLIKRDSFLLGAIKSKQRFEKIQGDDIIRLNGAIQLVRIDGETFVIDTAVLEKNLGFTQLIFKAAGETTQAIEELDLLEDIQVLKDAAEEVAFARKLSKVKKSSPIFQFNISKEAIIAFTKTIPALSGKFKYNTEGNAIRLDTKKSKDAFIKLMNDAFLHSELTKQYYEAKAKDNITLES